MKISRYRLSCMMFFVAAGCGGAAELDGTAAQSLTSPATGVFSVLSYNIDGLPAILQSGRFPGGNPDLYTPYIGQKTTGYDIVNVQEDFNSHAALYANDAHPYRTATSGGAGIGSGLNSMSNFPFSDDIDRVTWSTNSSTDGNNLTPKGFTWLRLRLAEGVYVDLYNLHTNAGDADTALAARRANITQIVRYIQANSAGNAVIVYGDTNTRYTRADDNIRDLLAIMDGDVWVNLEKGGTPPAAGSDAIVWDAATHYATPLTPDQYSYEVVDKILYRSNRYIALSPLEYSMPDSTFRSPSGDMLSDHYPVSARFQYTLSASLALSDQFGGPHGASYSDVDAVPARPIVASIGLRSGSRIDQISLSLVGQAPFAHGGAGGTASSLTLQAGEYPTKVDVCSGQYNGHTRIFSAKWTTSLGRTLSGGTTTSSCAAYSAPAGYQIVGFHGRAGDELDKVGLIYAPSN